MVEFTNISDDDQTIFYLARKGYGSVEEINSWDTQQFLDAVEYERIQTAIDRHLMERD